MNNKRQVGPSRYVSPDASHAAKWEHLDTLKVGRTTLQKGRSVKITGVRAATFEFQYAERNVETGAIVATFVGGRAGHRTTRSFTPDRIAKVLRW